MLLDILISEDWTPAAALEWRVRDEQGRVLRAGRGEMPAAASCRVILPAGRVSLGSVRPPARNRGKFMRALAYALEDRLMADPESVHVAVGPASGNGDLPVAIVERAWLAGILAHLRGLGVTPGRLEVETLLAPWREGSWTLVWQAPGGFVRTGPYAGMAVDGGGRDAPPPALMLALAEAETRPASIRLHGADLPDVAQWSAILGIAVEPAGEWMPAMPGQGINLLQGEFSATRVAPDWLPRLRTPLILAGALLAVHIVFTLADWAMLKQEKRALAAGMEQHFRSAFPDARVIVDAPLQMRRNLAALRHAAGQTDAGDFLPLLAGVTPLLKDARIRSLEYRQGMLKLSLTLPDAAAVTALEGRLRGVAGASLQPGNPEPAGMAAELTVEARS